MAGRHKRSKRRSTPLFRMYINPRVTLTDATSIVFTVCALREAEMGDVLRRGVQAESSSPCGRDWWSSRLFRRTWMMHGALPPPLAQGEPWTQTYWSAGLYSTGANSSLIAFPLVNAGPLQLQLPCNPARLVLPLIHVPLPSCILWTRLTQASRQHLTPASIQGEHQNTRRVGAP